MSRIVTDVSNLYFTIQWNSCVFSRILILSGYIYRQIILASLDETDHVRGEEVLRRGEEYPPDNKKNEG